MQQDDESLPRYWFSNLRRSVILRLAMAGVMVAIAAAIASRMPESPGTLTPVRFAFAALLMAANCWLGPVRLALTARAFEADITLRTAARAITAGFFASSLGLSVAGQAGGAIGVLSLARVKPARAALIFAAERGIALCALGGAGALAAMHLYGAFVLPPLGIACAVAISGVGVIAIAPVLSEAAERFGVDIRMLIAALVLTGLMQVSCLAAWLVLLASALNVVNLAAGATLVMLASAIPLGLVGFGPREIGAVAILSTLGIAGSDALSAALAIGFASLAAVTLLGLWAVAGTARRSRGSSSAR